MLKVNESKKSVLDVCFFSKVSLLISISNIEFTMKITNDINAETDLKLKDDVFSLSQRYLCHTLRPSTIPKLKPIRRQEAGL